MEKTIIYTRDANVLFTTGEIMMQVTESKTEIIKNSMGVDLLSNVRKFVTWATSNIIWDYLKNLLL